METAPQTDKEATQMSTAAAAGAGAAADKRELILYLEPRPASQLRQAIESLLTNTSKAFGHNEALRFMPHVTMVGFFSVPDSDTAQAVQKFLHATVTSAALVPSPASYRPKAKQVIQPAPDLVLIDVEAPQACHQWIQLLQSQFPSLHIRLKAINHLSLCYWHASDDRAPLPDTRRTTATTIAQQARAQLPLPAEDAPWDMVLYSIHNRSPLGHEPYTLHEVQRWQLL